MTASGNDIQPGEVLNPGQSISSENGQYTFIYQDDGNLVLYRNRGAKPLWATNTDGKPAGVVIMQGDGNFVMSGPDGEYIWDTATDGNSGAGLVLQDEGNLVIYRTDGAAIWATDTVQPIFPTGPAASGNDIQPGEVLNPGQSISSENGQYTFIYQDDGNLVLYRNRGAKPLWATNTDGKPAGVVIMQGDGNLVMYGPDAEYIWDTATDGNSGAGLVLQDEGNLVIYRTDGAAIWATDTVQPIFPTGPAASGNDIQPGEVLNPGQSISSENGQYTFIYQDDGNLVLYQNKDSKPLWASRTVGKPGGVVIMQGDGNLVMSGSDAEYIWDTETNGNPGAWLSVQDDGNVVIHGTDNSAIWISDSLIFKKSDIANLDKQCWVEVRLRRDGEIRFRGHIHNGGIEAFAFNLGVAVRSDTFAIGMAHEGRVGGLFWPRDYDWDLVFNNPMAGLAFTRLLDASLDVKAETRGDITGPFGDIAKFLVGWVIGGIILTPALVQIIFVGVAVASLAATGGFAAGARLIGGTLWLLGPDGTMVALISEGVAALGSKEREISQGEYDFANGEVFKGTLPPRERIILTDTIGGNGRQFVFPRFDGKITVNIGPYMYANPMNDKGIFIHELTHTWQLHNTLSEASFIAQAAVCALAGNPYLIPNPLPPFAELNMEQQAALVETWFNSNDGPDHPYYRYIEENIRTGNG